MKKSIKRTKAYSVTPVGFSNLEKLEAQQFSSPKELKVFRSFLQDNRKKAFKSCSFRTFSFSLLARVVVYVLEWWVRK